MENETENNDSLNVEEVVDESTDETTDNTPTLEDYEALKEKNKVLFERAKKAEALAKTKKELLNKSNETQSSLSREEAILYAKGYTDEEVQFANKIARIEGVSPLVAIEDELFKGKVNERKQKELSEKAALPASGGSSRYQAEKPTGEMTEEEHKAYFDKVMGN